MPFLHSGHTYPSADSIPHGGSWPGALVGGERFTTWPTPTAGPGGYPSALSYPGVVVIDNEEATDAEQVLARDLAATVTFTLPAGYGYRIERAAGTGTTPHYLPGTGGAWTLIEQDTADAGGSAEVIVTVPANDSDYTLAIWAINPAGHYSDPLTINVFGLDEPPLGPAGARYASIQVTTTRGGWPKIEVDTDPAFGSPTVYDGEVDASGWLVCLTSGDVQTGTGTALPTTGFPAGSNGRYLRVTLPVAYSNRHVRGYQGSEPTA